MLRFRQYPVAWLPPDPLHVNNIFVVKPAGSVDRRIAVCPRYEKPRVAQRPRSPRRQRRRR